jgi:hypothetical protein
MSASAPSYITTAAAHGIFGMSAVIQTCDPSRHATTGCCWKSRPREGLPRPTARLTAIWYIPERGETQCSPSGISLSCQSQSETDCSTEETTARLSDARQRHCEHVPGRMFEFVDETVGQKQVVDQECRCRGRNSNQVESIVAPFGYSSEYISSRPLHPKLSCRQTLSSELLTSSSS